jgi:hypothetical protein
MIVVIEMGWKIVDWIHPAYDGDQWHATVNTVMNPIFVWLVISSLAKQLLVSQVVLGSKELFFDARVLTRHCKAYGQFSMKTSREFAAKISYRRRFLLRCAQTLGVLDCWGGSALDIPTLQLRPLQF